MFYSYGIKF